MVKSGKSPVSKAHHLGTMCIFSEYGANPPSGDVSGQPFTNCGCKSKCQMIPKVIKPVS